MMTKKIIASEDPAETMPPGRTVASRIYYAIDRIRLMRLTVSALIDADKTFEVNYAVGQGVIDLLEDVERALEPLNESSGPLPHEVYCLIVPDVPTESEREWHAGYAATHP